MTDLPQLSIAACRAMNLVADLPHKSSETILYPRLAEDDGQAVTHCLPWFRERLDKGCGLHIELYPDETEIEGLFGEYRKARGKTLAEALCRLVVRIHEAEDTK